MNLAGNTHRTESRLVPCLSFCECLVWASVSYFFSQNHTHTCIFWVTVLFVNSSEPTWVTTSSRPCLCPGSQCLYLKTKGVNSILIHSNYLLGSLPALMSENSPLDRLPPRPPLLITVLGPTNVEMWGHVWCSTIWTKRKNEKTKVK